MATSANWVRFPNLFPNAGALIWVRLKDWNRQPFQATWSEEKWFDDAQGVVDWTDSDAVHRRLPWAFLDAWKDAP